MVLFLLTIAQKNEFCVYIKIIKGYLSRLSETWDYNKLAITLLKFLKLLPIEHYKRLLYKSTSEVGLNKLLILIDDGFPVYNSGNFITATKNKAAAMFTYFIVKLTLNHFSYNLNLAIATYEKKEKAYRASVAKATKRKVNKKKLNAIRGINTSLVSALLKLSPNTRFTSKGTNKRGPYKPAQEKNGGFILRPPRSQKYKAITNPNEDNNDNDDNALALHPKAAADENNDLFNNKKSELSKLNATFKVLDNFQFNVNIEI